MTTNDVLYELEVSLEPANSTKSTYSIPYRQWSTRRHLKGRLVEPSPTLGSDVHPLEGWNHSDTFRNGYKRG
jgi:hypothetical protein